MNLREKYRNFAKRVYFRMNKTRRSKLFGLINWIYIYSLKALYFLLLCFAVYFLVKRLYSISGLFMVSSIIFMILDGFFSLQREQSLLTIIQIIKERIKQRNYDSIRFRVCGDLCKDVEDYWNYEVNTGEENSKKDLEILLTYLKYFVCYRDFEDKKVISQFQIFIDELEKVFESRAFNKIPKIINDDFIKMKLSKDYKVIVSDLKANNKKFREDKSIFLMLSNLNKQDNFFEKLPQIIINLLGHIDRYKYALILIMIIILSWMFITGKIDSEKLELLIKLIRGN